MPTQPSHPECAARITHIRSALEGSDLLRDGRIRILSRPGSTPRAATDEEIGAVHGKGYLAKMRELSNTLEAPIMIDESTYISRGSSEAVAQV